ncbi:Hsp70 family protein [Desulfitibacter alkalitolerans]|uniref:Hsp70 family protein n=1 Tax=Desulfitibacter alkalitolerans TaxID=264641 RepID=UPI0004825E1F|nr:Hsp70 family protein [Desulfitibacter alkalitolerans]
MKKTINNNQNGHPIVGIDLGTTNSAVAFINKGRPEIIPSPSGERIIPSVVHINQQGQVEVGKTAQDALIAMPSRTIAAVKRKMGSEEEIILAGQAFLPHEISALILKKLKEFVDARLGEGDKEAVITVPAYFTDKQRRATKQAGELAGFIVERIVNEPTAAAMAYGLFNLDKDKHILVYDLGGGTFDVSVVEIMGGILDVKASTGNSQLGGEDFDWRIAEWMAQKIQAQHGVNPLDDLRAKAILKEEAEQVKKLLSERDTVEISLPVVLFKDKTPIGLSTSIERNFFEEMIEDLLKETMDKVQEVLTQAELTVEEIDEILLVGGSTRIPMVSRLISQFFGKSPRKDVHPDEAVALGAAVQAGIKSGLLSKSGMVVTDVAPFSMGISVLEQWKGISYRPGGFSVIIPKNTTIPVTRSEKYYTVNDGQEAVSIEVYQGEHERVKYNHHLGKFLLEGIPSNSAGAESIEVKFHYNINGILEVSAKCLSNDREMSVLMQDALDRFSEESFLESTTSLENLWKDVKEDVLSAEEEEWKRFQQFLDDAVEDYEAEDVEKNITELKQEVKRLIKRSKHLLEHASSEESAGLQEIIESLNAVEEMEDVEEILEAINNATDALIELET